MINSVSFSPDGKDIFLQVQGITQPDCGTSTETFCKCLQDMRVVFSVFFSPDGKSFLLVHGIKQSDSGTFTGKRFRCLEGMKNLCGL